MFKSINGANIFDNRTWDAMPSLDVVGVGNEGELRSVLVALVIWFLSVMWFLETAVVGLFFFLIGYVSILSRISASLSENVKRAAWKKRKKMRFPLNKLSFCILKS